MWSRVFPTNGREEHLLDEIHLIVVILDLSGFDEIVGETGIRGGNAFGAKDQVETRQRTDLAAENR